MKIKIELDDGYEEVFEVDEENDAIEDLGTTKEMMQARINELEEMNRDKSGDVAFYQEANKACQKEINALRDKAKGWEKRCEELEQELRDAQERIHEQDWTIGCYDQENGELREKLAKAKAERDEYRQDRNRLMDETTELRERMKKAEVDVQEMWKQNRELGKWLYRNTPPHCLGDWAKRIHDIAVDHGWWETEDGKCDDGGRPFPEIVALCHSELSEALEEYRNGRPMAYQVDGNRVDLVTHEITINTVEDVSKWRDDKKAEGLAVEMLDCVIRILDWMGHEGIDVDTLMEKKVKYNEGRKHRHGGKKA